MFPKVCFVFGGPQLEGQPQGGILQNIKALSITRESVSSYEARNNHNLDKKYCFYDDGREREKH